MIEYVVLAGLFTWLLTTVGASLVFATRNVNRKIFDASLGFASGVMISASFFSLLIPSIRIAESWIPATVGFLMGGAFLGILDRLIPHLHVGFDISEVEGPKVHLRRATLLVLAVTLHNVPEGLSVGVSFGESLTAAFTLALGIAIQNVPEGFAISLPLRAEMSKFRSFTYGSLSGVVEPIFAIIGFGAISIFKGVLPFALAFAAGAMIFVVVEELIPESQLHGNTDLATASAMVGFAVMMVLDVALS